MSGLHGQSLPADTVLVNPDRPEEEPVPYQHAWTDNLDDHAQNAIAEKVAGVVAGFGTPTATAPQRAQGFDPNARGGSFDPREQRAFTPKSYENLVTWARENYPNDNWRIDIQRDKPSDPRYRGYLATEGAMTMPEFIDRFGGGEYACQLVIERVLPTGEIGLRPVQTARFSIPGTPNPLPIRQNPHAAAIAAGQGAQGHPPGGWPPGHESEAVAVIRAKAEVERERAMFERAFNTPRGGGEDARYLTSLSESSLKHQAEQHARTIEMLQRQLELKGQELEGMRDDIRKIRKEADDRETEYRKRLLDQEALTQSRVKEAREEADRAAHVQYEGRLAQKESDLRQERMEKDRIVAAERDHAQRRIDLAEQTFAQREAAIRAEAERNLSREKDDRAREVLAVQTSYEARLNSAQRDNSRDKDANGQITTLILSTKDSQNAQLASEVQRLRTENDTLRAQVFKPFPAMVKEIQSIAPMLGYTHSSEQETPDVAPEKPEPPKSILEQLVAAGPSLLKVAGPAVAQMLQGGAQPAQPQPPMPPRAPLPPAPVVVQQVQPQAPQRSVPVVAGQQNPPQVTTVVKQTRRAPQAPAPVPAVTGDTHTEHFEPIATPARFRKRSPDAPQPASPSDIQEMLSLVTNQAKEAIANNQPPSEAAAMVKGLAAAMDPTLIGKYTTWVDAENALVLLDREDGQFWGREDAREWFDSFWTLLGQP